VHVLGDLFVATMQEPTSGSALVMISPSSSKIRRSTPWVAGWLGPMFSTSFSPTMSCRGFFHGFEVPGRLGGGVRSLVFSGNGGHEKSRGLISDVKPIYLRCPNSGKAIL
jgi:hypothetical protein